MCLCFSVCAFGRTTFTELLVHTYSNAFMLFRMNFKFKLLVCHFLHAFLRKLGMILVNLVTVQYHSYARPDSTAWSGSSSIV